jgi:hypothetical protein
MAVAGCYFCVMARWGYGYANDAVCIMSYHCGLMTLADSIVQIVMMSSRRKLHREERRRKASQVKSRSQVKSDKK